MRRARRGLRLRARAARARSAGGIPGVAPTTPLDDLLEDDAIEAVVIATPVSTHFPLARAALEAGQARLRREAARGLVRRSASTLIARGEASRSSSLMPGHTFLYSPPVDAIHELIASGELGELASSRRAGSTSGLHQSDVSVMGSRPARLLDPALLARRNADARQRAHPRLHRSGDPRRRLHRPRVRFRYDRARRAFLAAPSKLRRTTIVGSKKMVVYDDTSNEPVRVFDSGVDLKAPETSASTGSPIEPATSSLPVSTWRSPRPRAGGLLLRDPTGSTPRSSGVDRPRGDPDGRSSGPFTGAPGGTSTRRRPGSD